MFASSATRGMVDQKRAFEKSKGGAGSGLSWRHMEKKRGRRKKSASLCVAAGASRGRKADCHRDTGLDPKTIRKWWDTVPEGHITVKIRPSQALSDLLVEEFKKGL